MQVHFIGIGGIGVSALAKYYLEMGHKVSGSDLAASEITKALKKLGAKIYIGSHKIQNLPRNVDLVVYSPAVTQDNPELKRAQKLQAINPKLQIMSYPQALGELTKKYFTIAITGTHGKSTTTAMIGLLLAKAGFDPTVIVGTKLKEFGNSNFRMGCQKSKVKSQKSILVIEADEHFASFLNYWPKIIVLTTIEADHLDFYKNLNNILKAFKKFIGHLPKNGILVANCDDQNISKLLKTKTSKQKKVNSTFPTIVENVLYFSLRQKEAKKMKKILKIPGDFNVSNALAALTVARALKIPDKISFEALSEYKGSWRRFELIEAELRGMIRGKTRKIIIVNDYAHHPTNIRVTLKAAREKFPKKEIWAVFQPHQYQRTHYLFDDFVKVLKEALRPAQGKPQVDKLIITDIFTVAGREKKEIKKKVSSEKLVKAINKRTVHKKRTTVRRLCQAEYIPNIDKVARYLKRNLRGGEVVIIMGAGDIYKLASILVKW